MRSTSYPRLLIILSCLLRFTKGTPVGAVPGAKPAEKPDFKTVVTTATDQGSAYTLTYMPSTVTAPTTIVEGTSTVSVNTGAVVGALAGAAAAAALPFIIPKVVPPEVIEGEGPDEGGGEDEKKNNQCKKKIANICTQDCTADWFVSKKKVQTTSKCSSAACQKIIACSATDETKTNSHTTTPASVVTVTTTAIKGPPTGPPVDYLVIQAHLGKEYLRLHIDGNGDNADPEAKCEKDLAKGVLEKKGIKENIADFCKSNKDFAASPNKALLRTYDQEENRMQVVLQVSYAGDRGEGATYTIDEKKCNDLFGKLLKCGTGKAHIAGGSITSEKGLYSIAPYMYPGELNCAPEGGKYGVAEDEALANIDDFCTKFDGQKINQGEKKENKYFQKVGGLLSTVSVAWEPGSVGCEKGGAHDHGYLLNKAACKRFLSQQIKDCNKGDPKFKAGGITTDQCAKYQIFVESRETVICGSDPRYPEEDRARWHPFDAIAAQDAIKEFCDKNLLADPNAKDKSGGFSQTGDWPKGIAKGGKNSVSIEVTFPNAADLSQLCSADTPQNQAFKTGGENCQRRLGKMIVDGCDTDKAAKKTGGWLVDSGYYGCVQWQIGTIGV